MRIGNNASSSVADLGCLSRIPDPNFSILDPNFFHPRSRIRLKDLSILTPKNGFDHVSRGQKGTGSRISDLDPQHWLLLPMHITVSLLMKNFSRVLKSDLCGPCWFAGGPVVCGPRSEPVPEVSGPWRSRRDPGLPRPCRKIPRLLRHQQSERSG
jgi:hypothetical protein